jgi:long-subunit fatty acid transport protein
VSWQLVDDFELAADVRYWHYQVLQEQRSILKERIAGLEEIVDQRNYGNSLNVAVGLRHSFAPGWDFMLGYQRDYSPIPDRTVTLDSPARDRHGVATGIRWQARDDLRVGLAWLRNWYDLTENQQSPSLPPNNAKGTGANMAFGLDVSWSL